MDGLWTDMFRTVKDRRIEQKGLAMINTSVELTSLSWVDVFSERRIIIR